MATAPASAQAAAGQIKQMFDPALFDFLVKLRLSKVGCTPSVDQIYGQYNQSLLMTLELDDAFWDDQLVMLLTGLMEMGEECSFQVQGDQDPEPFNLEANFASYINHVPPDEGVEHAGDLIWGVYWFGEDGAATAQKRVYIHLAHPIAACGVEVLKALVPKLRTVPGFQKVKMFGPQQGLNRNDSIVAYCTDEASQAAVANTARALSPRLFQADIPRWVKLVCPGVGVADEPPRTEVLQGEPKRQSFGKFLSKLIWLAWTHNKSGTDDEFFKLVLIALRTAKIDPRNPHRHSLRAEVEEMQPCLALTLEKALTGNG